ncbi:hypothetical protein [Natrinema caseinilyticum]|uniref:hypothetical protein n=1 Tax=Natrinema caseinilyticum TaxID=2961570 RepID=UPI0020C50F51|nr:hypothetical protein [Natrinema caseinilyticum]
MSINSENVERHTASVVILAGALATAAIYLLSDYVTIEQTVLVASTPVVVAAFVAAASILYWQLE